MTDKEDGDGGIRVDTALVRQLAELLDANDLSEIEVEDNGRRIVVKRKLAAAPADHAPPHAAPPPPAPPPSAAPAPAPGASVASDVAAAAHPGAVKSPMVGTVYLAGEPGATPFVSVGASVAEGDTLVVIEAMKVMNQIAATRAGVVRQILVQDAQPVEYDQPLVVIE